MSDRYIIASYLLSPLCKITNPENTSQLNLVKDSNSSRVTDLLKHNTIPVTSFDNLLIFRDTNKEFELQGDLLKLHTTRNYNFDLANLQDKKILYDFPKELYFDVKALGFESTRDISVVRLLRSPGLMNSASGTSNPIFLLSDSNERYKRLKLLPQEKQAGKTSVIIN